jgi:hypothetical protein
VEGRRERRKRGTKRIDRGKRSGRGKGEGMEIGKSGKERGEKGIGKSKG